jgi:CRP-like cAMP-binding protein
VGTLTPGDLFGEMALFTGQARSATIRADGPSTILQLPRERFSRWSFASRRSRSSSPPP